MEKKSLARRVHCLVLAFPVPGHINPMQQFSKLLQHKGVKVTLVTTLSYCKNLQKVPSSIPIETISDGFDNGGIAEAGSFKAYLGRFWEVGPKNLAGLIEKLSRTSGPVDCIVYDSFLPWALDVAKKFGILGASFLIQNMMVNSIFFHVKLGNLQVPLMENEICLPALPKLQLGDMPSFFFFSEHEDNNQTLFDMSVGQFSNIHQADWILCNSFYDLEKEVIDWVMKIWPKFKTIGPSTASMMLDKGIKDDEDNDITQFKGEECIQWLDDKLKHSVVYVSFGSIAELSIEQTKEFAYGLRDSGSYFIWVVRASEESKLPKDFEKNSKKGLMVTWCSQLKVLAHEAIGCFVTHCGWNSTLEAISLGVPMVAVPQRADQSTNAKNVVDVWKMGIRAVTDEKNVVRRQVLINCINEVMKSEKGKELKNNAMQWKTLAARAIGEDGSSNNNIAEFVNSLCCESKN